jgi:hypothetical protein
MSNSHIGGSFESFLDEEGFRAEVEALAQERVSTWQNEQRSV